MASKAVILAAGSASRMQENLEKYISDKQELAIVKKGEKMGVRFKQFPFLDFQILNLIQARLKKINLVLRKDDSGLIDHYQSNGRLVFTEAEISYSFQEIPDGTAHAVLAAEDFIRDDRTLILNGDNHYPSHSVQLLVNSPNDHSTMVAFDLEGFNSSTRKKLNDFAVVKTVDGDLERIVEKPKNPENYRTFDFLYTTQNRRVSVKNQILASMNLWCFNPDILDACMSVRRHEPRKEGKQGEFELPDAIELYMRKGHRICVYYTCADVLDLTNAEDIKVVDGEIRRNLIAEIKELERRYDQSD